MIEPSDLVANRWGLRFGGRRFPCAIGRGGLTNTKAEGDGATPRGVHHVVSCLYRPDRMPEPCSWATPIRPGDLWSDDPNDPRYNHKVRAPYPASHETLRRCDPLYDLVLTTDWNWPDAVPGKGSAIFIHSWRAPRFPTAGCVGLARNDLLWIVARIKPGMRLVVG